jgi:hypothetical protein
MEIVIRRPLPRGLVEIGFATIQAKARPHPLMRSCSTFPDAKPGRGASLDMLPSHFAGFSVKRDRMRSGVLEVKHRVKRAGKGDITLTQWGARMILTGA